MSKKDWLKWDRIDLGMDHYCDAEIVDKIKQYQHGIKTVDNDMLKEHINGQIYLDYCKEQLPIFKRELRRRKLNKLKYGDS
jgi:hypothetical protein